MSTAEKIRLCMVNPDFLHTNGMIHNWIFSAFGELIDNASDPDVKAEELKIDKVDFESGPCLVFEDDGAGINEENLHKMLSFGYCEKKQIGDHKPIGQYGNGFKSGSMRIGTDALVFTKTKESASIGFLSQTYNKAMDAKTLLVPITSYSLPEWTPSENQQSNLEAILQYSIFNQEEDLIDQLNSLEGTGTKIIISNLKRLDKLNILELDFVSDQKDIRCPEPFEDDTSSLDDRPQVPKRTDYRISLRQYCRIHFLKPRMTIFVRGERVKKKLIIRDLTDVYKDKYKPSWLQTPVEITFGFTCDKERSDEYGMMIYNRNRLVKAFERVGYQKKNDGRGKGVIGVAELDFLQAVHDKQNFAADAKYNAMMRAFGLKLNEYWDAFYDTPQTPNEERPRVWTWVTCDKCHKNRRLPASIEPDSLPDEWYCLLNPDATHNRCDIPEEPQEENRAIKSAMQSKKKKARSAKRPAKSGSRNILSKGAKRVCTQSNIPSKVSNTPEKATRRWPVSVALTSPVSSSGDGNNSNESEDTEVIDLTDDATIFKVPLSVTIKTESKQPANHDESSGDSSLFLSYASKSNVREMPNKEAEENVDNDIDDSQNSDGSGRTSDEEIETQDTTGDVVTTDNTIEDEDVILEEEFARRVVALETEENVPLEDNHNVEICNVEALRQNSGNLQKNLSPSENQDADQSIVRLSQNTEKISMHIGNKNDQDIGENSGEDRFDFLVEQLEVVQAERDEYSRKLRKLKENVFKYLQLQAPDKNLGTVDKVDELLEKIIYLRLNQLSDDED